VMARRRTTLLLKTAAVIAMARLVRGSWPPD
jgi:hypothetical protein